MDRGFQFPTRSRSNGSAPVEPPDRESREAISQREKPSPRVDFNVLYMVTFDGYITFASFLPTLSHERTTYRRYRSAT
jgi:hypothetical protein